MMDIQIARMIPIRLTTPVIALENLRPFLAPSWILEASCVDSWPIHFSCVTDLEFLDLYNFSELESG